MQRKMKGTYDILPSESSRWQAVERAIRRVSKIYNYKEIRTPIFEQSELFHRSVGEDTDIVSKETYDFKDRGDRDNTLRPEGTAGVVRSVIENKLYAADIPVQKLYYMGPMFRYERPQKGRYRQFHQFGAEAFGSNSPLLDAEMISYAVSVLKSLKLKEVTVKINSLGDSQSKEDYKIALLNYLEPNVKHLCKDCQTRYKTNPLRILDCKVDKGSLVLKEAPKPLDYLTKESQEHFDNLVKYLDQMDIAYTIDKALVRGLDYYTHTVFEVDANVSSLGAQKTLCGGGRYNNLVNDLDGPDIPAVGFAFGIERLLLALESIDYKGDAEYIHLFMMILGDDQKEDAAKMIQRCRLGGLYVDTDFLDRSMKSKFNQAESHNARFVAIYGANEKEANTINIKDQESGIQETIETDQLYTYIMTKLMEPSSKCETCEDDDCDDCS
ncbi:MAG: histidine--tRNA ligase [Candidatus Izimaplasma sp.]|nr:histidine--tRNA ligase [Candidatus Izimaplasma bacterium]